MINVYEDNLTERKYPACSLNRIDFQNVFGGDLLNITTTIESSCDYDKVKLDVLEIVEQLTRHLCSQNIHKSPNDKIQIIVGWDESVKKDNRQIYKASIEVLNFQLSGGKFIQGWEAGMNSTPNQ